MVQRVVDPRDRCSSVSAEAAMVVLGPAAARPVRSLLLGSVGVAVTRHAKCPVDRDAPAIPASCVTAS